MVGRDNPCTVKLRSDNMTPEFIIDEQGFVPLYLRGNKFYDVHGNVVLTADMTMEKWSCAPEDLAQVIILFNYSFSLNIILFIYFLF